MLMKVVKELQRQVREQDSEDEEDKVLELDENWERTYHLSKCKTDCADMAALRTQLFLVCEEHRLSEMLPPEMQHEIDLIGEQLASEDKIEYNPFSRTVGATDAVQRPTRKLIIPTLGSIYANQIQELPSPDMVHIEDDADSDDE